MIRQPVTNGNRTFFKRLGASARLAKPRLPASVLACTLVIAAAHGAVAGECATGWQPGNGIPGVNGEVFAVTARDPDGPGPLPARIVVGGRFTIAGDVLANSIAEFDPHTGRWSALGSGPRVLGSPGTISALGVMPNGDLIAGGGFDAIGGVTTRGIARWDGTDWSAVGSGPPAGFGSCKSLTISSAGRIAAVNSSIVEWDGQQWTTIPNPQGATPPLIPGPIFAAAIYLPGGQLVVGGAWGIRRLDPTGWTNIDPTSPPATGDIRSLALLPGGDLLVVGDSAASPLGAIARYNGTAWSGYGPTNQVQEAADAVAVLPNGNIVAGGSFSRFRGVAASGLVQWNGTGWLQMGDGVAGRVNALTVMPGGDLVAVGAFIAIDGRGVSNVARWNGSSWSPLGSGFNQGINTLTVVGGSDIVAGGRFLTAGSSAARLVARFSGGAWSPLGPGVNGPFVFNQNSGPQVFALHALPDQSIVVGGNFRVAGPVAANRIARWNGTAWSALGTGITSTDASVKGIVSLANGDIVAAGDFTMAGMSPASRVARWNGSVWSAVGGTINFPIMAGPLLLPDGRICIGVSGPQGASVLALDGSTWTPVGQASPGSLRSLTIDSRGRLVAGCARGTGLEPTRVVRLDGNIWTNLGSGLSGGSVLTLLPLPNGDVIAAGDFLFAEGAPASRIARWNGTNWQPMGSGISDPLLGGSVTSLALLANGDIVAGGDFTQAGGLASAYIARFADPTPWITEQPRGTSGVCFGSTVSVQVQAMAKGRGALRYQWRRGAVELDPSENPSARTATLVLTASSANQGSYDCVVSNDCASLVSAPALLSFSAVGPADVAGANQSMPDGQLTPDDVIVFLNWFFAGDARANIAGANQASTPDAVLTADDVIVFLNRYFAGCGQ